MTTRIHWAVAIAALVGAVGGSYVAPSMDSLGLSTTGNTPLLAGAAAIYLASMLGAALGAAAGAVFAFAIVRVASARVAALVGSVVGLAVSALAGYFSGELSVAWVNSFAGNPLMAALAGGILAGGYAGVATAAALRLQPAGMESLGRRIGFSGLGGGLFGLLAGAGGGSIGVTLAQSITPCPNGYYIVPRQFARCAPGLLQGSLLVGMWAGAVTGAILAIVAAWLMARLARLDSGSARSPAPADPRGPS